MSSPAARFAPFRVLLLLLVAILLGGAAVEFYNIALGTGNWLGGFSLKWAAAFFVFILCCLLICMGAALALLWPARLRFLVDAPIRWRARLGGLRWLVIALVIAAPLWLLQYAPWGVVINGVYLRLLIWLVGAAITAFLIERCSGQAWSRNSVLIAVLLTGAAFVLILPFGQVSGYPFALGWSEGNRLWDYSLMFALHRYQYQPGDPPVAYLEPGRQLVGALPFLWPRVSIAGERLWLALLDVLPYLVLGLLAFRPSRQVRRSGWVFAGIWAFMFLSQGPIHPPLLVCAILVAIAWRSTLWWAVPLLVASGYYAAISRFTWIFAPAIWAAMLEFGSASPEGQRMPARAWVRAVVMASAGLFGSLLLPKILDIMHFSLGAQGSAPGSIGAGISLSMLTGAASRQPLLWYRLFPNATYGSGILVGLLFAAGPLMALLLYLSLRHWRLNRWQRLAILLPSMAFVAVGLVVSTKIGGGGDLHNLDMFLIGLLFAAVLAWRAVGSRDLFQLQTSRVWLPALLLLTVALPAYRPLMALRPLSFSGDESWLMVLTGAERPRDLGFLPSNQAMSSDLEQLRQEVQMAQENGQVLFIDQRQLLTFGFIRGVRLVPEYEKKRLMDEALSGDHSYFESFYHDLAAHRFSLIISDPLRTPIKDSDYGFGEENNAWVRWVTKPVLCYYEEKDTLTNVRVELLVPRQQRVDCIGELP